jgi:hypothetical protein
MPPQLRPGIAIQYAAVGWDEQVEVLTQAQWATLVRPTVSKHTPLRPPSWQVRVGFWKSAQTVVVLDNPEN